MYCLNSLRAGSMYDLPYGRKLASDINLVVPGHDPLLKNFFPEEGNSGFVWRLDKGPIHPIKI